LTTNELTQIVAENSRAIAANTASIAELTKNILILHDSIKSLENTALAHDAQIDELIENGKSLQKEWQAYIKTLPRN